MQRIESATFLKFARVLLVGAAAILIVGAPLSQELVLAPGYDLHNSPVVVFPDLAGGLPNPPRHYILPLDAPLLSPHGLALIAANRALVTAQLKAE